MRWPRQLMSLLLVLSLLVGPPLVLLSLTGPPIHGWPTAKQARAWIEQPLTEQTLTAALTIAAWLIWLALTYTVTLRTLTRIRTTARWLRHLPLPTPLQATATGMAGAAVLGVSANAATTPPPQAPHPVAAGAADDPSSTTTYDDGSALTDDGSSYPADGCRVRSPSRSPPPQPWSGCAAAAPTSPAHPARRAARTRTWRRCPRPPPPCKLPSPTPPPPRPRRHPRPAYPPSSAPFRLPALDSPGRARWPQDAAFWSPGCSPGNATRRCHSSSPGRP
ncbi:hypothetical protein [Micromonospora sp. URMC 103]|uniref:hypothetical protein n=1 Tax=Micromonospora sp. URMC 103 TaxID=3423406 RepID=UPI003F1B4587